MIKSMRFKVLGICIIFILISGCTKNSINEYQCNYEHVGTDYKYSSTVDYKVNNDDEVIDAKITMTFNDKGAAINMFNILMLTIDSSDDIVLDENKIYIYNYQNKVEVEDLTKNNFEDYLKSIKYQCQS